MSPNLDGRAKDTLTLDYQDLQEMSTTFGLLTAAMLPSFNGSLGMLR